MITIWKKILSLFAIIITVFLIIHNTETFRLLRNGDLDTIILSLRNTTFSKFFFTFIIMVIQNSFTVIPLIIIITINYALFGFLNGLIWSWLTSIIAAGIWFFGSRYFFNDWVQKKTNPEILAKMEKNGLLFVFQARIIPFVPTSLINILSGLSSITFKHFIIGTMFGNLIFFFVLSLIPAGLMEGNTEQNILLGIAIILVGFVVIFRLKKKQKRRKQVN
ncbi:TVP38/TMEM64 family protein [Neobacillus niacini]|uniref:TVP38/TMEM64 family protein n=1 Tax=Neobacillus niacini TaxID=86668 RepID=UPI001C8E718F|nr:VTT domain-containing protein [Neobacillus niacini]MBY0147152.1 VTT domain-containing protein [Neobacillus niacini]